MTVQRQESLKTKCPQVPEVPDKCRTASKAARMFSVPEQSPQLISRACRKELDRTRVGCNAVCMATTQKRIRPVAVLTLDPSIHARLVALAVQSGLSLSRVVDAVLTRQLELPLATL